MAGGDQEAVGEACERAGKQGAVSVGRRKRTRTTCSTTGRTLITRHAPGWSTSCTNAAMTIAIFSTGVNQVFASDWAQPTPLKPTRSGRLSRTKAKLRATQFVQLLCRKKTHEDRLIVIHHVMNYFASHVRENSKTM